VPNTSAILSEIWSIGLEQQAGLEKRWPNSVGVLRTIASESATRGTFGSATTLVRKSPKNPYRPDHDHQHDRRGHEQHALMICTHVVATIPPNST
jgi:hypothetical protein